MAPTFVKRINFSLSISIFIDRLPQCFCIAYEKGRESMPEKKMLPSVRRGHLFLVTVIDSSGLEIYFRIIIAAL